MRMQSGELESAAVESQARRAGTINRIHDLVDAHWRVGR